MNLLPQCLKKCFLGSDEWHTCTTDLLLFKKIFNSGCNIHDKAQGLEPDPAKMEPASEKLLDAEQILNIDFKNIEKLKTLEMLEQKEDLSFVMHPLCKIRSHCYFTAAACISNGFQVDFLLKDCEILSRLMADLKQDTYNDYIFQYLILFMQALAKDSNSIFKLMEEHADSLYDLIVEITEQTKRATLAKTLIYLILKAPERLCSLEPRLFGKVFEMAINQEDPEITENVLWLQSSLIELKSSDEQYQHAVELCHQFKSAEIYSKCIQYAHGPIVLQALKGLTSLASIPQFRPKILIDLGDTIFQALAQIVSKRLKSFGEDASEIENEVVQFLSQITESSAATKDPLTVAGKRRVVQQGFMEHFLARSFDISYKWQDESQLFAEEIAGVVDTFAVNGGDSSEDPEELDHQQLSVLHGPAMTIEEIEQLGAKAQKEEVVNKILENTLSLAANVTELHEV